MLGSRPAVVALLVIGCFCWRCEANSGETQVRTDGVGSVMLARAGSGRGEGGGHPSGFSQMFEKLFL